MHCSPGSIEHITPVAFYEVVADSEQPVISKCDVSNGPIEDITPMDFCEVVSHTNQSAIATKCDVSTQYCSSDCYICPNGKRSTGTNTLKLRSKRRRNESDKKNN